MSSIKTTKKQFLANPTSTRMSEDEKLTQIEYNRLPQSTKAYHGISENEFISVSPSHIQFPHDDITQCTKKIIVWNKTKRYLTFRIEQPKSKYFTIFYDKAGFYGGTEAQIIVKCKPYDQKLTIDRIKIQVANEVVEPIIVPLEVIPSMSWFILPKFILLPPVPIGTAMDYVIKLPSPPFGSEFYNFFISGRGKPSEIEISPTEGRVGPGFVQKLKLIYSPLTYTSLTYELAIHFPEIVSQPFKITVYLRCMPGLESAKLDVPEQKRNLSPKPKVHSKAEFKSIKPAAHKPATEETQTITQDLCTPAAVMKFLLQRGGKVAWSQEYLGPLGLTSFEEQRIYKAKEKEFHDKLVRVEIQQRNSLIQPYKVIHGDLLIQSQPEKLEEIQREREIALLEYQKALGMMDNDIEDLSRRKLKIVRQRMIRDADVSVAITSKSGAPNAFQSENTNDGITTSKEWIKKAILRPFIQAALIIITRKRADKRIVKLKKLAKRIKKEREMEAEENKFAEAKAAREAELKALNPSQAALLSKILAHNETNEAQLKESEGAGDTNKSKSRRKTLKDREQRQQSLALPTKSKNTKDSLVLDANSEGIINPSESKPENEKLRKESEIHHRGKSIDEIEREKTT